MEQINSVKFVDESGKVLILCESDTSLGVLHDFLLRVKGEIVEKMIGVQKQEEKFSEEQMKREESNAESSE